jgi:hypothetical protein
LVDAHPQYNPNLDIWGTWDKAANEVVELRLIAETSEHDFGSETGVARIQAGGVFQQQVRSIAALSDFVEDVVSDLSRGGDQVPW